MTRGAVEFVENKQANSTILQGTTKQDMKAVPWLEVPCRAGEKRPRRHGVPALVRLCKITLPAQPVLFSPGLWATLPLLVQKIWTSFFWVNTGQASTFCLGGGHL